MTTLKDIWEYPSQELILNRKIEKKFVKVYIMLACLRFRNGSAYWNSRDEINNLYVQWMRNCPKEMWNNDLWHEMTNLSCQMTPPKRD